MTMTIDLSPETEASLEREAALRGQALADYARQSFEVWVSLTAKETDTESAAFEDMRALSLPTLQEYWINDEDAVYDSL